MNKKTLLILLFSIAGLFFLFVVIFISNFSLVSECGNNFLNEVVSPNEELIAVVVERNCGATTDFATMVSIEYLDYDLGDLEGIIFLADDDHNAAPHGRGRSLRVEIEWISNDSLKLMYHPKARVFQSSPERNGIKILYKDSLD